MKLKIIFCVLALGFVGFAFQDAKWVVPDKYQKMKNPVAADAASISDGKALWSKHCASCHGKTGLGDGSKTAQLKTQPEDMSKAGLQSQSDGALFFKTSEGKGDMPAFKKKIPDEDDLWSIVNFMRTLKK